MQFSQTILLAVVAAAAPSLVSGVAIPASNVQGRGPEPVASAAGTQCSTVAGAVGVSVVCNGPNGKTIDGQPAAQVKQNGLKQNKPAASKGAAQVQPTKAAAKQPTATASAAGTKCSTVAGAVGVSVVCNGPNGKTIDGQPASQVQ